MIRVQLYHAASSCEMKGTARRSITGACLSRSVYIYSATASLYNSDIISLGTLAIDGLG